MTAIKTRALAIFVITSILLATLFFTLPINIFNGEMHVVEPNKEYVLDVPLSLSNFVGLGYDEADMEFVESFHLKTEGWIMAFLFIFGFPALLAYRIYLKWKKIQ